MAGRRFGVVRHFGPFTERHLLARVALSRCAAFAGQLPPRFRSGHGASRDKSRLYKTRYFVHGGAFPPRAGARTQSRHRVWLWSSTCSPEDAKPYEEKREVSGPVPGLWSLRGGRGRETVSS